MSVKIVVEEGDRHLTQQRDQTEPVPAATMQYGLIGKKYTVDLCTKIYTCTCNK